LLTCFCFPVACVVLPRTVCLSVFALCLHSRFGRCVAKTLPTFSLDVLGVIARFSVFTAATEGAKPARLDCHFDNNCMGLCCDPAGRIWIASDYGVRIINEKEWGTLQLTSYSTLVGPSAITFDRKGESLILGMRRHEVYTVGSYHNLEFFRNREFIPAFTHAHSAIQRTGTVDAFSYPLGIAVDKQNRLWIADADNHRLQVCDRSGKRLKTVGSGRRGNADGQFDWPRGIAIHEDGSVFVSDQNNHRIQVMHLSFSSRPCFKMPPVFVVAHDLFLLLFCGLTSLSVGVLLCTYLCRSSLLCFHDRGLNASFFCGFLQVFDAQGRFVRKFGTHGNQLGELAFPCGIAFDLANNLVVCDRENYRVQLFRPDGKPLTAFEVGTPRKQPICACVGRDGRVFVGTSTSVYTLVFS
jgi:hypothetical protein